jgi:hypothetical protein
MVQKMIIFVFCFLGCVTAMPAQQPQNYVRAAAAQMEALAAMKAEYLLCDSMWFHF